MEIQGNPTVIKVTFMINELKEIKEKLSKIANLDISFWQDIFAYDRALLFFYQNAHWTCKGANFYQDHLLFQRIYEGIQTEIDQIAERAIGTSGEETVNLLSTLDKTFGFLSDKNLSNFVATAIEMERRFLGLLELADKQELTIGTRDFLNGLASTHEEYLYLLNSRS